MNQLEAEYILETSWEVCNKVGGIYTVLSTRAASLQKSHKDKVIFFGPDVWKDADCPYFIDGKTPVLKDWPKMALKEDVKVRVGRWDVPGKPIAVLVDFQDYFAQRNDIYTHLWERYQIDSLSAYGDYDEASMFGYAAGAAMASLYRFLGLTEENPTVAHFNEWMTSFGLFYVKEYLPQVATLFTTHATSIGRSIAGNNKPLYDRLQAYNGDQMAEELNMVAKHSTEKRAAELADCFTTVSEITDRECEQLLGKKADIVTPNGFENGFVPKGQNFMDRRNKARKDIIEIAEIVTKSKIAEDTLLVGTSGRYEFKNKGLDVFIASLKKLSERHPKCDILALIVVPAHIAGARQDLVNAIQNPNQVTNGWNKLTTHELYNHDSDAVVSTLRWLNITNDPYDKVKVLFVPAYISENDPIFEASYYDFLIGLDMTVFPSYYEPWGYTPLESVAFHIPTVTTSLSGFGQWARAFSSSIMDGVGVINRGDYNTDEVIEQLTNMLEEYITAPRREREYSRKKALNISKKAQWIEFITHYYKAYDIALRNNM